MRQKETEKEEKKECVSSKRERGGKTWDEKLEFEKIEERERNNTLIRHRV